MFSTGGRAQRGLRSQPSPQRPAPHAPAHVRAHQPRGLPRRAASDLHQGHVIPRPRPHHVKAGKAAIDKVVNFLL